MTIAAALRAHLRTVLDSEPGVRDNIQRVYDEPVADGKTALPYIAFGPMLVTPWGGKGFPGREIRLSIQLAGSSRQEADLSVTSEAVAEVIAQLPDEIDGGRIVTSQLLQQRNRRRTDGGWTIILDYQFRISLD